MGKRFWLWLKIILQSLASVRIRLTLWYLAILALVFLVFGAITSGTVVHEDQITQQNVLVKTATLVMNTYSATDGQLHLVDPWNTGTSSYPSPPLLPVKIAASQAYPLEPGEIALLLNAQGAVKQQFGPLTTDDITRLQALVAQRNAQLSANLTTTIALTPANGSAKGNTATVAYLIYTTDIYSGGHQVAMLLVGRPYDATTTLRSLVPGLLIAGPLTLLIAAIGGYWLATRAMRPVRLITQTAQEIGETDLSRRLNLKRRDELGQLASTFDRMLGRLQGAFERQRQFTADASHELRTPLTIVNLEVTRALAQQRSPAEYERALVVVQSENERMTRLVNDLLLLARADAGRLALAMEPVDLSDITLAAVERLAPLAHQSGLEISVGALPELTLEGNTECLTRMLTNLVENAVKYTQGIGHHIQVETGAALINKRAWSWARIEDDGPGIAAEHLPHLFDRFYQAAAARSHDQEPAEDVAGASAGSGGSGLGLSIAQWVAQVHGGEIRVRSVLGSGATFEVWLPLPKTLLPANSAIVPYARDDARRP